MPLRYYFLTIDHCNTSNGYPTKDQYYKIIAYQFNKFKLDLTDENHPIKCFEHKHKSLTYPKWLHFHCIVHTYLYVPFSQAQCKDWSLKYIRITNLKAMARIAGYIQKNKIDSIDIKEIHPDGELKN